MLTKSKIKKAGHNISHLTENDPRYQEALQVLSEWRGMHVSPMQALNMYIRNRAKDYPNVIVAQRLKRLPTIISKLKDKNLHADLYSMQDIGGVRVIFEKMDDLNAVAESLPKTTLIRNELWRKDYISTPKPSGYRGIHVIYETTGQEHPIPVELQMRTLLQHAWAMTLETFDVINKTNLKRGYGNAETDEFMRLCSALFSLEEGRPVMSEFDGTAPQEIVRRAENMGMTQKLQVFAVPPENIFGNFTRDGYYLLQLDAEKQITMAFQFDEDDAETAEKQYVGMERRYIDNPNMAVVLVSASKVKDLQQAYPSYFLDTQLFLKSFNAACDRWRGPLMNS